MAGKSRKKGAPAPVEFRSHALAEALERQDVAAVALALRHGNTVVPLMGEVWTYRDPKTGEVALLLFSDAANMPANLPQDVGLHGPAWLRTFLKHHESTITTVFLDIAGPHPMQAPPDELLRALEA